jgi:HEXXH motif-containing protein
MRHSEREQRGFACPQEPLDGAYLREITRKRSARLTELFLKCFAHTLRERSDGLLHAVETFRDDPGEFPDSWPTAVGQMRAALLERPLDAERALVAALSLALARAQLGMPVRFDAVLGVARAFRFASYAWPGASEIRFESDGTMARVRLDAEARRFERAGAHWVGEGRELPCVRGVVLVDTELPDGLIGSSAPDADSYRAAFELIERFAGSYLPWVQRVTHAIVPVKSRPGATVSSSFEMLPGVLALSHDGPALCIADLFVHEASHQHYYLATQTGPVHDGSDQELYYSPGPRTHRPVDKILLAYHAFANLLLFYRACRDAGVGDGVLCSRMERSYEEGVAVLEAPLEKTRALTPLGRALFEPLAERLTLGQRQMSAGSAACPA